MIILPILKISFIHFLLKRWEMYFLNLGFPAGEGDLSARGAVQRWERVAHAHPEVQATRAEEAVPGNVRQAVQRTGGIERAAQQAEASRAAR